MRRAAMLVSLLLLVAGCGGGSSSPTEPTTNLNVVVHELNPPTFTRIPGVALAIQGKSAVSDARGEARFTNLQPGETTLSLSKSGYRSRNQPIRVNPGENTTSQEMLPE
jgi:hypothetical protein